MARRLRAARMRWCASRLTEHVFTLEGGRSVQPPLSPSWLRGVLIGGGTASGSPTVHGPQKTAVHAVPKGHLAVHAVHGERDSSGWTALLERSMDVKRTVPGSWLRGTRGRWCITTVLLAKRTMTMAKPTSDEGGMKESEEKNRSKKMPRLELVLLAVALAVALPKVLPFFEKNDHTPVVDKCDCPTHSTPWENYDNGLGLEGNISDCCCDYATVNKLNRDVLNPLLSLIVKQPYFKYFKVNLWCDCPFWEDEGMCSLRDCSVCECTEEEKNEADKGVARFNGHKEKDVPCAEDASLEEKLGAVDRQLGKHLEVEWSGTDNPWVHDSIVPEGDLVYINLLRNPERFTGFQGENSHKIWNAIYSQDCFREESEVCEEKRLVYRLISGTHSSITAHIAGDYLLDEENKIWGPNLTIFETRLAQPEQRFMLENLYFTYLFVLRAVMKAGDVLSRVDYYTGSGQLDAVTSNLMKRLVQNPELQQACPVPFHEGLMWTGEGSESLKQELQTNFRNISRIMDCVGCEKCRLWGKLQTQGLGTALKILFSTQSSEDRLLFSRNEIVALVNYLNRLSESLETVRMQGVAVKYLRESQGVF